MQDLSPEYNFDESESREVNSPFIKLGSPNDVVKDFRLLPQPSETETEEEVLIVPPKDESAPGSARFSDLQTNESQPEWETNALAPASKVSGKDSDKSEQTITPKEEASPTEPESSSPDSSTETSPGSETPPALDVPPINVELPKL